MTEKTFSLTDLDAVDMAVIWTSVEHYREFMTEQLLLEDDTVALLEIADASAEMFASMGKVIDQIEQWL